MESFELRFLGHVSMFGCIQLGYEMLFKVSFSIFKIFEVVSIVFWSLLSGPLIQSGGPNDW
ncbi:hypothetical protein HK096_004339, partial [Nowakowskiella sp. JEL0078]